MERRLTGRRTSSKLPQLIELVMSRPLLSTGMVAKAIDVTPQTAVRMLGLREIDGEGEVSGVGSGLSGRHRAWATL
ncbi:HTH DNA-binding domain-containing protein (plasmid) [Rhizobium gallicum]|uniref:HTH DNA-binding domain-containing protein n=1 Tax=Rhizobium gallicum TaxID=56730 RepID=A0A1L5NRS3_9HYPH|nr:HTH DNA-binding domain-containing protein [Rhizobium gallicum]